MKIPKTLSEENYEKHKNETIPVIFKIIDARDGRKYIEVGNSFSMRAEAFQFKTFDYQVIHADTGQVITEERNVESVEDRGYGMYDDHLEEEYGDPPRVSIFRRAQELLGEVQEVPYGVLYKKRNVYEYSGFSYAFFHALYPLRRNSPEAYSTYGW